MPLRNGSCGSRVGSTRVARVLLMRHSCSTSLSAFLPASLLTLAIASCASDQGVAEQGELDVEPTRFMVSVYNLAQELPYFVSGSFDTPEGAEAPGPLLPGQRYSVEFHAPPGTRLSFATMFVPSNDLFFAPTDAGIELFDAGGQPVSGELSEFVHIWDAGTEADEALGAGEQQAPQQAAPGMGDPDPDARVRLASETYPELPAASELISVTLEASEGNAFRLTLENISTEQSLGLGDGQTSAVPLAPGVFVIHGDPGALFVAGEDARAEGLEALAEDGDPSVLAPLLAAQSGVVSPLAPGMFLVHEAGEGIFAAGEPDAGLGLESLAEDGDPNALRDSFSSANAGVFGGVYGDDLLPLQPGGFFAIEFDARPGELLSVVSMFAQSNDIFLSNGPEGIELFDAAGEPIEGELSANALRLWDAGTELNEAPGAGPHQAPRQSGPNVGPEEGGVVRPVDDGFAYPAPEQLVRMSVDVLD